jgi:heat shock protein HspQ
MDYKYNLWINSTIFQIHHWSVFMSPVRANNVVEGWHNRFNSNIVTRGPVPFYHLVIELYAESADILVQLNLVSDEKLQCYQHKHSHQVQGQVFHLWEQYVHRDIAASQLLWECPFVYGPPAP